MVSIPLNDDGTAAAVSVSAFSAGKN